MSGAPAITARLTDAVIDRGLLPDPVLRAVIRTLLFRRRERILGGDGEARAERKARLLAQLRTSPVAIHADEANTQHYEVPTGFFEQMLGPHLKYSSAYWPEGVQTLEAAEAAMLALTCRRADLHDGQEILELGCGWGSLTLWMAAHYPSSHVTAVSNSRTQREHIEKQAAVRGLDNVTVVTCDVNRLGDGTTPDVVGADRYDRVVSVEMFEHVRNHATLLARIASWLRGDGRLFVHHFAHASQPYPFELDGRGDWMARHFFTGGLMPSDDLLLHLQDDVVVDGHWVVPGTHYAATCEAWLARIDADRGHIVALFDDAYGAGQGERWLHRWRVFTIACAELFAYDDGDEWFVTHLRFAPRRAAG